MKCFYHSADLDGHCSGAIIKMVYPKCEMFGINYGEAFPWVEIEKGELVFMVDFSLQPFKPDMNRLDNICHLVWIDHHQTAITEAGNEFWKIDGKKLKSGVGACQLVWKYLTQRIVPGLVSNGGKMPLFVKLLAEYDVWNHSDPRTLSFQYGMRQQKSTLPDKIGRAHV